MDDDDQQDQPVEEVEPKIILSAENIQEGLSQLYRTPGKSSFILNLGDGFDQLLSKSTDCETN
jgi:hypothetical protein